MNEETVVVRNGVTVRKSFSADDFPVPAVTFEVASTREEPVELRITDTIPEGFGVEQIGFHPDYGSEHWTATGEGGVRFERPVEPGEEFTTVYGVRMNADDEPTVFLEKPAVEVNPAEAAETADVVPEESSEVVRELARGERETVPGLEPEDSTADAEPDETEPTPTEAGAETPLEGESGVESTDESALEADAEQTEEAVADVEAEPSEADPVDDPDAEEFVTDAALSTGGSESELDAEDEHGDVESDVAVSEESERGTDETESLIEDSESEPTIEDSKSSADETAADSPSDSAAPEPTEPAVETPADGAETTPEETAAPNDSPNRSMPSETDTESIVVAFANEIEAGTIDDAHLSVIREALQEERPSDQIRLEHLQSRVSDLEAYTDALERFLDEEGGGEEVLHELETEIGSLEEELADTGARLDEAAAERDTMSEHLENLENTVEALAGVAEQIERVRGDVEALDERLTDVEAVNEDVSDLEAELESVREELSEITEWRDQLSDVFG